MTDLSGVTSRLKGRATDIAAQMAFGTALIVTGTSVAGCSSTAGSPLGETQWQVTQIFDGTERAINLPESQQGRAFIVIGQDSLTGISGCLSLRADVHWNNEQTEISVSHYRAEPMEEARPCSPSDEDTAQRLGAVINDQHLSLQRPSDTAMKLQRTGDSVEQWQTPQFVEFISGPTSG